MRYSHMLKPEISHQTAFRPLGYPTPRCLPGSPVSRRSAGASKARFAQSALSRIGQEVFLSVCLAQCVQRGLQFGADPVGLVATTSTGLPEWRRNSINCVSLACGGILASTRHRHRERVGRPPVGSMTAARSVKSLAARGVAVARQVGKHSSAWAALPAYFKEVMACVRPACCWSWPPWRPPAN